MSKTVIDMTDAEFENWYKKTKETFPNLADVDIIYDFYKHLRTVASKHYPSKCDINCYYIQTEIPEPHEKLTFWCDEKQCQHWSIEKGSE